MSERRTKSTLVALALLCAASLALLAALPQPAEAGGFKFKLSRKQEVSMGQDMNKDLTKDPGLITKGKDYEIVQRVGKRLVSRNDLKQYDYKFFLIKQDEVNAFATPGGYIYVTQGLMKYMRYDEAMLAGVMGHELGHAKDRHTARGAEKQIQATLGLGIISALLGGGKDNKTLIQALGGAAGMASLKYSRDFEEWADRSGVELSYGAGYDAYGLVRGLEMLNALYGSTDKVGTWMASHPSTKDRISRTSGIAKEVSGGKEMGYVAIPKPPKDSPLYGKYGTNAWKHPEDSNVSKTTSPAKPVDDGGGVKDLDKK